MADPRTWMDAIYGPQALRDPVLDVPENPWAPGPEAPREYRHEAKPYNPDPLYAAHKGAAEGLAGIAKMPYDVGHAGAELGFNAANKLPGPTALSAAELAGLFLVPGRKAGSTRPARTLEEYVEGLNARPGILNYDTYLSDPLRVVGNRDRRFETQEPAFKRGVSEEAKKLNDPATLDTLREKRDEGLLIGPDGHPVNPWYWPAPMWDAFSKRLGPELADERLGRYLDYNASTSMMTRPSRAAIEAWHLLHHDINDIPINKLNTGELTGGAYPNKVAISGQIASGEGITGDTAHKIRNYKENLRGVGGAEPEYNYATGERILTPLTLDSIMAEAMGLQKKGGEPSDRFRGPIYREGMKTIHGLGEEVGAPGSDTQAAIWQPHQFTKHKDPVYMDPFARIFDDMIQRVAAHNGEHPEKVLDDLVHGTKRPPNTFARYGSDGELLPPPGIAVAK